VIFSRNYCGSGCPSCESGNDFANRDPTFADSQKRLLNRKVVSLPAKSIPNQQSRFLICKVISLFAKSFPDLQTRFLICKRICKSGNDFPGWETNLSNGMARLPIGKRFCELGWLCCRPGNDFANSEIALRNGNAICGLGNGFANQHARHPNRQTTLLIGMALLLIGKSVCESELHKISDTSGLERRWFKQG